MDNKNSPNSYTKNLLHKKQHLTIDVILSTSLKNLASNLFLIAFSLFFDPNSLDVDEVQNFIEPIITIFKGTVVEVINSTMIFSLSLSFFSFVKIFKIEYSPHFSPLQ